MTRVVYEDISARILNENVENILKEMRTRSTEWIEEYLKHLKEILDKYLDKFLMEFLEKDSKL